MGDPLLEPRPDLEGARAPGEAPGEPPLRMARPWDIFWRNFRHHRAAMLGVVVLALIVAIALGAPLLTKDPFRTDLGSIYLEPSVEHPLGTDAIGRDYLARVMWGGRVSLRVGLFVAILVTIIGTAIGAISGYKRGPIDAVTMRLVDLMLSIPLLPVLLVAGAVWGSTLASMSLVLSAFLWAPLARIVRGSFLSLREREMVQAALSVGASDARIIFRHILPNAIGPIVVNATLLAGLAIILESTLSFLGFGIQPPAPTWGTLLTDAKDVMFSRPWMLLPPGLAIVVTVLAINFIGDGLRDALDPTQAHLRLGRAA